MNFSAQYLLLKIWPFYLFIILGYFLGKFLNVDRKSIAHVLFYTVIPFVFFDFATRTRIELKYLALPVIVFLCSTLLNQSYYHISKRLLSGEGIANLVALSAGTGNTGYFGLPIAMILFDQQTVGIYMLMNIGLSFYDYTLGAFVIARGKYTTRQVLFHVIKLPILYAFGLGLLFNYANISLPESYNFIADNMRGVYIVLGMMIVGLGLAAIEKFSVDLKVLSIIFSARFVIAPILALILIDLDVKYFHFFPDNIHLAFLLLSLVPPAANVVVFASLHHCHPEKAATVVLIGTLFASLYLPLMIGWLF